jgi:hypothetical protein
MRLYYQGRCVRTFIACFFASSLSLLSFSSHAGPMDLGGQFAVNESGAATYTIPIQTPPGTSGIEPKLALSYNSQSGNGLLGVGWSLSGLSAIGRCPRTLAQDGLRGGVNFDANDRFCLDGQRLMVVNGVYGADGAEYRTERESFSKIVSYGSAGNGPAWFKVWTKAGQIIEYGNTADSRIEAIKASGATASWPTGTVRAWAQNKLSDTKGNYYTLTYTEDATNGDFYPLRIDYTGNANTSLAPNNSVQFDYEARTDQVYTYTLGAMNRTPLRLSSIKTYIGTTAIKELRHVYTYSSATFRSHLASIADCSGDGLSCQPAITFTCQDTITGSFVTTGDWASGSTTKYSVDARLADVNSDGKTDLILQYDVNGTRNWEVRLSTGTSFETGTIWGSTSTPDATIAGIGDVNGDGKVDLILQYDIGSMRYWKVLLSNGYSFLDTGNVWGQMGSTDAIVLGVSDLNGDGLADMVVQVDVGGSRYWQGYLSTGTSFNGSGGWWSSSSTSTLAWLADVNGDGMADLVIQYYQASNNWVYYQARVSTGSNFNGNTPWWFVTGYGSGFMGVGVADMNGDGLSDLLIQYTQGGVRYFKALVSTGVSYVDTSIGWTGQDVSTARSVVGLADVTGEGRADLTLQYDSGGNRYWQSLITNDAGSYAIMNWSQITSATTKMIGFSDLDGDGKADMVIQYDIGDTRYWQGRPSSGPLPGLLSSLRNGYGTTTSFTHKSLTDSTLYTKGTGSIYPVEDIQYPLYVVSSVSSSNGVGGTLTTNYKYGGLKAEIGTGRGLLGFNWIENTQVETGVTTRTEYRQDWPYVGLPSQIKKTLPAAAGPNNQLSLATSTYGCLNPQNGSPCAVAAGNRYFPYSSQSIESSWDLNGAILPTLTTSQQFDTYGNAIQVTASTGDGYSKTTTNTYQNDTSNWYLGRLLRSQVQSIAP